MLLAVALLLAVAVSPRQAGTAEPACADLRMPEAAMVLEPIALGVTRPRLPLPEPPPPSRAAAEHGPALLPAFVAATVKPWPPVRDPGAFACTLTRFRGAGALLDCGVHLALHGDRLGARRSLAQSVAVEPRGAHASIAALWLGEIALREDRWDEAVEAYRTALASEPSDETAHGAALGLAWVALLRGDVPASLQTLAQALSAPATSPVLHMARLLEGVNLLLGDRYAEALVALDAVDPSRLPASLAEDRLFWRGVVLSRLGERARALETLERFLNGTPSSHPLRADALLQTGRIALESGAAGDAVRRFSVADQIGSRPEVRPHVQAGLVRSYLALGDTARVGETAQRLVRASPGDPLIAPTLLLIADAAMQAGAMAKAVLRRWYDEMWSHCAFELVPEIAGPTYTRHDFGGTRTVTAEEYRDSLRATVKDWKGLDIHYFLMAEGDYYYCDRHLARERRDALGLGADVPDRQRQDRRDRAARDGHGREVESRGHSRVGSRAQHLERFAQPLAIVDTRRNLICS